MELFSIRIQRTFQLVSTRSIRVLHRILTEYLHKAFFRPSGILQPAVHIEVAELQLLLRERFLFRPILRVRYLV